MRISDWSSDVCSSDLMPRAWTRIAAASLLAVAPPAAAASEPAKPPAGAAYALPETQAWDMTAQSGRTYRILDSLPPMTAPDSGYPVVSVLAANALFARFAVARRILPQGNRDPAHMNIL